MELRVSIHCKGCEGKVRKHISRMEGTLRKIDPVRIILAYVISRSVEHTYIIGSNDEL